MKTFHKYHDHGAYVNKIKAKSVKLDRRKEMGQKLIKGVKKALGIKKEKIPTKAQSPPSKSNYVSQKRVGTNPEIGKISPSRTPINDYVKNKKKETLAHGLTNQRQKAKTPYPHR